MTNNSPEALRKLVAAARTHAAHSERYGSKSRAVDSLIGRLADALEPFLDASERVGERDRAKRFPGLVKTVERMELCAKMDGDGSLEYEVKLTPSDCRFISADIRALLSQPQPPGAPGGGQTDTEPKADVGHYVSTRFEDVTCRSPKRCRWPERRCMMATPTGAAE